ncbi:MULTISPECIES: ArsR/SmtB family transcription factor [Kaistia]|uniref:Helix-turn-helix domain-containing protein n=1 Tax=Kaistia nematophila TaxID=2994654 RepID=A0A9X3IJJ8_9HYPH|nr:helix-turn-helix domain-containing protein [Kaistia nematophila]MCX5567812.1 helix-turn-helix domain-containing protein [Kaistia nematophila]
MAKDLFHPLTEQIDLSAVLEALSDPIRRDVVQHLMKVGEDSCGATSAFSGLPKTNLTYHLAKLREAGVTRARIDGAKRMISVRFDDLEARFPGLLPAILGPKS